MCSGHYGGPTRPQWSSRPAPGAPRQQSSGIRTAVDGRRCVRKWNPLAQILYGRSQARGPWNRTGPAKFVVAIDINNADH